MLSVINKTPFLLLFLWRRMRGIIPIPLRESIAKCAIEIIHAYNHRIGTRELTKFLERNKEELFVELAPGSRKLKNWICIGWGHEYPLDLRRKTPFKNDSVDRIYSSHVLEHFTPVELEGVLKECFRILRRDGTIEGALPNIRMKIEIYMNSKPIFIQGTANISDLSEIKCPSDVLSRQIYVEGQHHIFLDQDNITRHLMASGFSCVSSRKFDPAIDMKIREDESFYFVAKKE